jgi:hypothetical protein
MQDVGDIVTVNEDNGDLLQGPLFVHNMTQTLLPPLTRKLHMIVGFSDTCDFLLSVSHCGKFIVASRNDQAHTVPARKLTALFF